MTDRMEISDVEVERMKKVAGFLKSKVVKLGYWEIMLANDDQQSVSMRQFEPYDLIKRNAGWQINFVRKPGEAIEKAYFWCVYNKVLAVEKVGLELKPCLKPWPVPDGSAEWELDMSLNRTGEVDDQQYFHLKTRYGGNTHYLQDHGTKVSLRNRVPIRRFWRVQLSTAGWWSYDSDLPQYTCLEKQQLSLYFPREAKVVIRLRSRWGTYLTASEDKQSVILQPSTTQNTEWTLKYSTSSSGISLAYRFNIWSIYDKILGITEGVKDFRLSQLNWPILVSSPGVREWNLQINSRSLSDDLWGMLVDRNSIYIVLPCAGGSVMLHRHPCPVNRVIEDEVNWKIEVVRIEEPPRPQQTVQKSYKTVIKNTVNNTFPSLPGAAGNSSSINTGHNVNGSGTMTVEGVIVRSHIINSGSINMKFLKDWCGDDESSDDSPN